MKAKLILVGIGVAFVAGGFASGILLAPYSAGSDQHSGFSIAALFLLVVGMMQLRAAAARRRAGGNEDG